MNEFEHERLDVYQAAIQFLVLGGGATSRQIVSRRPVTCAASSVSFNIAEGAGEFAAADKARFYRMARRSATESAAILDACRILALTDESTTQTGRVLLLRVVAMLTAMVLKLSGSGSGST